MNAINGAASQPSSVSGESMQIIAQWLKTHSADSARLDARQRISQRYPHGLLSEAELDALLCGFRKI